MRRSLGGDAGSFTVLVKRHERRVYNLAYRMLGRQEDARDATQEAFLSCYRRLSSFRGDAAFATWLHRIALNTCYDFLRKRRPEASFEEIPERYPEPDHGDRAATSVDVQRALLTVPVDFRAVLVMHDVQGLPYEDIAGALSIPLGTVKSRLHRGRVALGRALTGEHTPEPTPSKPKNR